MSTPIKLAIVAPCYNEQDMLPISAPKLVSILHKLMDNGKITQDSFLLFVNDGSKDETWSIIEQLHNESPSLCHGINLSRNCGHQNAIMAGMQRSIESPLNADAVITIDIDLQDPLECIPIMVDDCLNRNDVVYGVRSSRKSDSFLKRFTAESFYKFQSMMGVNTIYNHADFRLMTRRVVKELYKYSERNLYLRGVIPTIGYPHSIVYEERAQREAGKTKYTLKKMLSLAFDGISSFSVRPIYLILMGGVFLCFWRS